MDVSHVVVFPTVFARCKIPLLISNIKRILEVRGQQFTSVRRDGDVILVHAHDPVFASSTIGLLYGIRRIAIAVRVKNDFKEIVSGIVSIGGNLLLKGDMFLVNVEGHARGFLPKDVEIAATSGIIEARASAGASPGTRQRHDREIYAYLTKKNAYVCIYSDDGGGGIPCQPQDKRTICAIYDEISAVSCLETIRQGHSADIMVCYRHGKDLTDLAKMVNRILPRLARDRVDLEFYRIRTGIRSYPAFVASVLDIMLRRQGERVSIAVSPLIFPTEIAEVLARRVFEAGKTPFIPLAGVGADLFSDAREVGLDKAESRLRRMPVVRAGSLPVPDAGAVEAALATRRTLTVQVGPNNVHDMLDALAEH